MAAAAPGGLAANSANRGKYLEPDEYTCSSSRHSNDVNPRGGRRHQTFQTVLKREATGERRKE
ncbi:hypothetical protein EYF80_060025 [Liparis tanakae]|uniref:Uncharacterized protein n=1 Tax=Liparis tanakae TaxID=230148 RepID=A0A4Z2ELJ0_9TELE|nr:hypothetical protein EYF80_060025 [Liparis tanakae]